MRKNVILLMLIAAAIVAMGGSCGPKPVVEQPPAAPIDNTPTTPVTPPTQPEQPKRTLVETQFQTVYFDFDKYDLRSDAKASLDANFALLQEFPDAIVKIEGHCDERGSVEYNLSLGEKRAKAVQNYLVGRGVATARLSIISYGKERPADNAHNESAWAKNRRAEFKVISQ